MPAAFRTQALIHAKCLDAVAIAVVLSSDDMPFSFHNPDHNEYHRRRMAARPIVVLVAAIGLAGCATKPKRSPRAVALDHGSATVISVDPYMRSAKLKTAKGVRTGWWNKLSLFYARGKYTRVLVAKPGDRIRFHGLYADGEIYLARARVVGAARP